MTEHPVWRGPDQVSWSPASLSSCVTRPGGAPTPTNDLELLEDFAVGPGTGAGAGVGGEGMPGGVGDGLLPGGGQR
jgi:hypothetical protein